MKNAQLITLLTFAILSFSGFVESADFFSGASEKDIMVVRIIDFESPAKLGDFFNFQYYLRDVSGIDDKVDVNFQIEKDGKEIAYGLDNFFLDASNRSVQSKIFLPSNLESGVYTFNIRASHGEFSSESYRTIEITVKNGVVDIAQDGWNNVVFISLIFLAILNLGLVYHIEKDKIGRIFNFREAFSSGEAFLEKHRFTLLVFSSFLIFGVLIYYLDYSERLPKTFAYWGYFILGALAVLVLARVIYDKFFLEKSTERTVLDKAVEKKSGTRFRKINDWLQQDVRFASKNEKGLKNNFVKADKTQKSGNKVPKKWWREHLEKINNNSLGKNVKFSKKGKTALKNSANQKAGRTTAGQIQKKTKIREFP